MDVDEIPPAAALDGGGTTSPAVPASTPPLEESGVVRTAAASALDTSSPRPHTTEESASLDLWSALESGSDVPAEFLHATLTIAALSDLLQNLRSTDSCTVADAFEGGGTLLPRAFTRDELVRFLTLAAEHAPFYPAGLLHALRLLGEAHLTPPPEHDPDRTYRTIFSARWYPRLLSVTPEELRDVQLTAAFLLIPKVASDDLIGATCAQRWANVRSSEVRRRLDADSGASSLYECALKRFEQACKPLVENVYPHVSEASRYDATGWTGAQVAGSRPGFLMFCYDAVAMLGSTLTSFGLTDEMDREWGDDGKWNTRDDGGGEFDDCDGANSEEIRNVEDKLRRKLKALKKKGESRTRLLREREIIDIIETTIPSQRAWLESTRLASSHAAMPIPLGAASLTSTGGATQVEPEFDASAIGDLSKKPTATIHATYVGVALSYRLRGLRLGRKWTAMDSVGAPLAALAGFTGEGEPGHPANLRDATTALLLFSASGAIDLLRSRWATAQIRKLGSGFSGRATLRRMIELSAACGSEPVLGLLLKKLPSFDTLSLVRIALRRGHTALVDAFLRHPNEFTISRESLIEAIVDAVGETPTIGAQTRLHERRASFTCGSESGGHFESQTAAQRVVRELDRKVISWSRTRELPLLPRIILRLIAGDNLEGVQLLEQTFVARELKAEYVNAAIFADSIAMLTYLIEKGCPMGEDAFSFAADAALDSVRIEKISHGRVPCDTTGTILRSLIEFDAPFPTDVDVQADLVCSLAKLSHTHSDAALEVLRALRSRDPQIAWDSRVFDGDPSLIDFAALEGAPSGDETAIMQRALDAAETRTRPHRVVASLLNAGFTLPEGSAQLVLARCRSPTRRNRDRALLELILESEHVDALETAAAILAFPLSSFTDDLKIAGRCSLLLLLAKHGWTFDVVSSTFFLRDIAGEAPDITQDDDGDDDDGDDDTSDDSDGDESDADDADDGNGMIVTVTSIVVRPRQLHLAFRTSLCEAFELGCVFSGETISAAALTLSGCNLLEFLSTEPEQPEGDGPLIPHVLLSPFPWDAQMISSWNLASWQYASEKGCPWNSTACLSFEEAVENLNELIRRESDDVSLLDALAAAEIHRHWLRERPGGCPCRLNNPDAHATPPRMRSAEAIAAIFAQGWKTVKDFLRGWRFSDKRHSYSVLGATSPRLEGEPPGAPPPASDDDGNSD